MLRFLMWRLLGLFAVFAGVVAITWLLRGGPGQVLRGRPEAGVFDVTIGALAGALTHLARGAWAWSPARAVAFMRPLLVLLGITASTVVAMRVSARQHRSYVRLQVEPYRGDHASMEAVATLFAALHRRLQQRWWRRFVRGQASVSLELHHSGGATTHSVWLAVTCPRGWEHAFEAVLRTTYPNCRLSPMRQPVGAPPAVLRLKKHAEFIKRVKALEDFERRAEPPVNRLLTALGSCGEPAFVQIAMTPTPALFEAFAKHLFKHHEARLSRRRRAHFPPRDRSVLDDAELRGALEVQHRPLFFVELRVVAASRSACERVAFELRAESAENRLVERGTGLRHGLLGLYARRVQRGEGNPLPSFRKGVFTTAELAPIWHLPSVDYLTVPFARAGLPLVPAPPGIFRPADGTGTLRDSDGAVSIHVDLRKQNTAVPGTVEQGKSSYLVATVAEDLQRERCAVIVLDPKGDAAEAAVSVVPAGRTCTLLDLAHPTCGFNPLAVEAPADVIADYVVAALRNLFSDADIRASSDRYLRNAIIAVLAYDRESTLWDAARLLSVGEDGYAYRNSVGARVRTLPEFKEISEFFTAELTAQLADARTATPSCALCHRAQASATCVSHATPAGATRTEAPTSISRIFSMSASTARRARA